MPMPRPIRPTRSKIVTGAASKHAEDPAVVDILVDVDAIEASGDDHELDEADQPPATQPITRLVNEVIFESPFASEDGVLLHRPVRIRL